MGTIYKLLDLERHHAFVLGKGRWFPDVFDDKDEDGAPLAAPRNMRELRARAEAMGAPGWLRSGELPEALLRFLDAASWKVSLWNDFDGDEAEEERCETVGSLIMA